MSAKHTPGPWMIEPMNDGETFQVTDCPAKGFSVIAETPDGTDTDLSNAEFIVRACNSHDDLLESLRETSERLRQVEYDTRYFISKDGPLLPEEWHRRDPESYAMWERAVDSIAKAEGMP